MVDLDSQSSALCITVCVLVAQSCPTVCNPMDEKHAKLPCSWTSPGKNTGVGCHSLLQGIFPTQGSNLGLQHCRQILYLPSEPPGIIPLYYYNSPSWG